MVCPLWGFLRNGTALYFTLSTYVCGFQTLNLADQVGIDRFMIQLDGTENKCKATQLSLSDFLSSLVQAKACHLFDAKPFP